MKIDRNEVFRYMGGKGTDLTAEIISEVEAICTKMEQKAAPKYVYKLFTPEFDGDAVIIGDKRFVSKNLAKHLKGAEKVAVLAGTLGTSSDLIIRESAVLGTVKLSAAQAAGTAMLEQVLDVACADIERETGLYAIPRFSAGYGDLALEYQADILSLCDATKRIGIALTDNMMMIPTKSVTAFVGLKSQPCSHKLNCRECDKKDCDYRR